MEINVSGRNINVGQTLTDHAEERLEHIADKFFSRSIDATAVFNKEGPFFRVDVSLHANQGINLKSRAEADEPYAAFEAAADKVEKQLRRYKRRLKNHHQNHTKGNVIGQARDAIFAPPPDEETDAAASNGQADSPVIIAETKRDIPRVSVSDAVMLMDLGEVQTLMFRNSMNDQTEVVYRRNDGNIGWISPGAG